MKELIVFVGLVVSFSSFGYGFIPTPLDSPVVVDYSSTGGSTGGNWGRGTARDSHGWIYAVYLVDTNDLVCCSRSTDNGRTWSRFGILSNTWSEYPNIVIDRGDSIYVDWEKQYVDTSGWDIYFSKFNGTSWTPPVNVSNQHATGTTWSSSLALDGRGNLHLTWLDGNVWYSYYANNVWSTPLAVTPGGQWVASMCADTGTDLHLAWQGWQIWYKECSGGLWGVAEQATPTKGGGPSIATDWQCRSHVAYNDSFIHVAYIRRDSLGWSTPYSVSDTIGLGPSITCDRYGRLYVVWGGPEGLQKLWYATYDGTAWSAPVRLRNDTAYADYAPRLGFPVSDSGIDLIWTKDRAGGGYNVMYWRLPLLPEGVEQSTGGVGLHEAKAQLYDPAPNPSSGDVEVSFALASPGRVSLGVFNISGQRVRTLLEQESSSGRYTITWNRKDDAGRVVPAGVYFFRLSAGDVVFTKRITLLR